MNVEQAIHEEGPRSATSGLEPGGAPSDTPNWLEDGERKLRVLARKHPYATVLGAVGVGYVLGGGLPRWAVRALLRGGTQRWGPQLLISVISELVTDEEASPRPSEPTLVHEEES